MSCSRTDITVINVRQYKLYGRSEEGWNIATVEQLSAAMAGLPPRSKYGIPSIDEVKIQEGLIFDPHSGDLKGMLESSLLHSRLML